MASSKITKLDEGRYHDYMNIVVKLNELIDAFNQHVHTKGNLDRTSTPLKGDRYDKSSTGT